MDSVHLSQSYRGTPRRQFSVNNKEPRSTWCLLNAPMKDEKLSWLWSHLVAFSKGFLNWKFITLNIRPLMIKLILHIRSFRRFGTICTTSPKVTILRLCFSRFWNCTVNQLIPSVHSSDRVNFRVQRPDWLYPFLTMPDQRILNQLLILVNLYQYVKNWVVSSVCSGEMVDLKILQSDWLRAFRPLSEEQEFSQI